MAGWLQEERIREVVLSACCITAVVASVEPRDMRKGRIVELTDEGVSRAGARIVLLAADSLVLKRLSEIVGTHEPTGPKSQGSRSVAWRESLTIPRSGAHGSTVRAGDEGSIRMDVGPDAR